MLFEYFAEVISFDLFTLWIVGLYVGKLKIDQRFARRTIYRVKLEEDK